VWANTLDQSSRRGELRQGVPLTYYVDTYAVFHAMNPPRGNVVTSRATAVVDELYPVNLAIDVAFALITSITLALASERFVFGRMRRGPRPETKEDPQ
jgi:hypothetical protein